MYNIAIYSILLIYCAPVTASGSVNEYIIHVIQTRSPDAYAKF